MSNFPELIAEFGASAGIPDMRFDENGLCRIVIDGDTMIDFELNTETQTMLLIGHVIPSVEEAGEDVLAGSLALNAEVARNKGSFLAYDEPGDEMLLLRRLDHTGMRYPDFEAVLNEFAAHIDYCRTALLTEGEADDEDDDFGDDAAPARRDEAEMVMFQL
jgi:hypothetical protein